MSGDILEWVSCRLGECKDVIVPLKWLWHEWFAMTGQPSFERFARLVLADSRFEHLYNIEDDSRLEAWGYFSGPRIKLRSREITEECVLHLVKKYNEDLIRALHRASEILQDDDDKEIDTAHDLREAIQLLEEIKPALTPWVHLKPDLHREGSGK